MTPLPIGPCRTKHSQRFWGPQILPNQAGSRVCQKHACVFWRTLANPQLFLDPGPRGPGNPFSDLFQNFPGKGLFDPSRWPTISQGLWVQWAPNPLPNLHSPVWVRPKRGRPQRIWVCLFLYGHPGILMTLVSWNAAFLKRLRLRSVCVCVLKRSVPKRVFEGGGYLMESPKGGCDLGTCVVKR